MSESRLLPLELYVEVTADDIVRGKPGIPRRCPIALAVARASQRHKVHVGSREVSVDRYEAELPFDAMDWQRRFDRDESVEPFAFKIGPWRESVNQLH